MSQNCNTLATCMYQEVILMSDIRDSDMLLSYVQNKKIDDDSIQ
jgi:hypothetical protein